MSTIIRLTTGIHKATVGNPADNVEEIGLLLDTLPHEGSDIIVLPRWALTTPECGSLIDNGALIRSTRDSLENLAKATEEIPSYLLIGSIFELWGEVVSAMAVLYKGEIVAILPCSDTEPGTFGEENIFACGSLRFGVLTGSLDTLPQQITHAAMFGCDALIFPCYEPIVVGQEEEVKELVEALSRSLGIAIAIVNGGIGGSSFPHLYHGFACLYECGTSLHCISAQEESLAASADLDIEIIRSQKRYKRIMQPSYEIPLVFPKPDILRPIPKNPFLAGKNKEAYLEQLLDFQAQSLATRAENIGITKFILGISGGLDSTLALLVTMRACDMLELPYKNIFGVTQPGMGTSDRTYLNALMLMEQAEITSLDISINEGSKQMLKDINHQGELDTTYENVQARERSQMLFNLANQRGAIVVGSGDLSEEALGFSTFGGDHLSNYNVNSCVPKTMLRELLSHLINVQAFPNLSEHMQEALDTPVSPELLPPDASGRIQQKTEDILGPYELHDFFLYYFVKYNMRPSKLYHYASIAFADSMPASFIKEKLELFIKRFCAAQFKRSCAPDAASITEVNLLNVNYQIPSDLNPSALLADLESAV